MFQRVLGIPVLLKPSTVMNMPTKKIKRGYETWGSKKRIELGTVTN